jgi:peptidoglycan DL-endopeptidase CwlO
MDSSDLLTVGLLAGLGYIIYQAVENGGLSVGGSCVTPFPCGWESSANAQQYVPTIESVGAQYNLPAGLLSAVAYQESDFNPNAVSSAGAVGMFQLMPAYYPNAGQSWQNDAATAAGVLQQYYGQYQDWQLALAAYNWGPGNLGSCDTLANMPAETQGYVTRISDTLQLPGSLVA